MPTSSTRSCCWAPWSRCSRSWRCGSRRVRLPSLLIYLLMGVLLGEVGLGIKLRRRPDGPRARVRRAGADPGRRWSHHQWGEIRPRCGSGFSLATVGVAVSVAVMAVGGALPARAAWELAVLLGAVMLAHRRGGGVLGAAAWCRCRAGSPVRSRPSPVSTTPRRSCWSRWSPRARRRARRARLSSASSCTNWPPACSSASLVGFGGAWVMRGPRCRPQASTRSRSSRLTVMAYAAAAALHASGFAAVYVAALVLGNAELPHRAATRSFSEGVAWLAQIGLFVMLGLLPRPGGSTWHGRRHRARGGAGAHRGRAAGLGPGQRRRAADAVRDLAFISWAGLRGAVPIVLDDDPARRGRDGAEKLFDIVFVMVVIYTLLTGPTLPVVARCSGSPGAASPGTSTWRRRRSSGSRRTCCRSGSGPSRGCTASRWGSCGCRRARRCPWSSATGRRWCRSGVRCCATGTTCSWSPRARCGGHRGAAAAVSVGGRLAQWLGSEPPEPSWSVGRVSRPAGCRSRCGPAA